MKTESRRERPYANRQPEPLRLNHQNASGTTTRLCFSVAHHCTKKREVNRRLPAQPTTFQKCHSMPRNLPPGAINCVSQSIMARVEPQTTGEDKTRGGQSNGRQCLPISSPLRYHEQKFKLYHYLKLTLVKNFTFGQLLRAFGKTWFSRWGFSSR